VALDAKLELSNSENEKANTHIQMQMTLDKALFIPCITFTFITTDPCRWFCQSQYNFSFTIKKVCSWL